MEKSSKCRYLFWKVYQDLLFHVHIDSKEPWVLSIDWQKCSVNLKCILGAAVNCRHGVETNFVWLQPAIECQQYLTGVPEKSSRKGSIFLPE